MLEQVEGVGDVVNCDGRICTIAVSVSIIDAAREMRDRGVSSLIVVDTNNHIVGIVTERDIVRKVVAEDADGQNVTIAAVMTANVLTCSPQTRLSMAAQLMSDRGIRHLPVIRDGVPVAMISTRDIMEHELATSRSMLLQQSQLISELEATHPGIGDLERTASGRIVI